MLFSIATKLLLTSLAVNNLEKIHNRLVRPQTILDNYDYIVVGAGGSGAVVAGRLAEDQNKTVLLLEAGGPQNATTDAPGLQPLILRHKPSEWDFPLKRQKYAFKSWASGQQPFPAARSFGGATVHNVMNYYRDSAAAFRLWDEVYGIKNWTYSDVIPYFLKSENNLDKKLVKEEPDYHAVGGPVPLTTAEPPDPILQKYVEIAIELGANWTHTDGRDSLGLGGNSGITLMQRNIRNGLRQSTATAFLENNIRPNLQTIGFAFVTKVLFDSNKRAIGVKFRRFGVDHTVYAKREVILSAGAINSPKILLLSGVGPKEHLKALGIPVVSDSSVGTSMNVMTQMIQYYDIIDQTKVDKPYETLDNLYDIFVNGKGPLTHRSTGFHCYKANAYTPDPRASDGCTEPRTEYLLQELEHYVTGRLLKKQWEDYYRPYIGHAVFPLYAYKYRTTTNGTIRLNSTDPFDNALTDPCVFCDPKDLDHLIKTFQTALTFYENNKTKQFIRRFDGPIPGCTPCADNWFCYEYVKCMAQTNTQPVFLSATNRMGSDSDPRAVVDNRFRVKGVKGLRVIDASAIPIGPPQEAWVIMLGERGADFIKEDNDP